MSEVKNMNVKIVDEDHIWVNGKQYVSLKRFGEARKEVAEEIKLAADNNKELAEENEALKVLLKNCLGDITDKPLTIVFNETCKSESDHNWMCCGVSSEASSYRCERCGAYRTVPYQYHINN
jgi:hypothetical protein